MKTRKFTLLFCFMLCACFLSARASSFGDIRVNARFLTDRMAFELNLNQSQYNDLFEINFDFLSGVDPYLTGMACADAAALDAYYRYLDERNDDLRWVLSSSAYARFLAIEYFFRPIYALNNVCYLRVYKVYPNRDFFYFGRPVHYLTYRGAHSRRFYRNTGFYRTHYAGRYQHPVYRGNFHSRPEFRKHDFIAPRPAKNPGYHLLRLVLRNRELRHTVPKLVRLIVPEVVYGLRPNPLLNLRSVRRESTTSDRFNRETVVRHVRVSPVLPIRLRTG